MLPSHLRDQTVAQKNRKFTVYDCLSRFYCKTEFFFLICSGEGSLQLSLILMRGSLFYDISA